MGEYKKISYVLPSKRFAGASNGPQQVPINLESKYRNYVQGDRTSLIDLPEIFNFERQNSTKFRLSGKIVNIFDNSISGKTSYPPFRNNLYYINPENSVNTGVWQGLPQYDEFSFIRNIAVTSHIDFVSKSATTYNWGMYISYSYSSTTAQTMSYTSEKFNVTVKNKDRLPTSDNATISIGDYGLQVIVPIFGQSRSFAQRLASQTA